MTPETIARYWAKVDRRGPDECWPWTGCQQPSRNKKIFYGRISIEGRPVYAHRVGFEIAKGPILTGLKIRHKCDFGLCQNYDHLLSGTHLDNMRDRSERGRLNPNRGSQVKQAVLIEAQVAEIKWLVSQPIRRRAIADLYGVSVDVLGYIARGQTWRHVEPVEIEFALANKGRA